MIEHHLDVKLRYLKLTFVVFKTELSIREDNSPLTIRRRLKRNSLTRVQTSIYLAATVQYHDLVFTKK